RGRRRAPPGYPQLGGRRLRGELEAGHERPLGREQAHEVRRVVVAYEGLTGDHAAGPDGRLAPALAHADPDDALDRLHVDEVLHHPAAVLSVRQIVLGEVMRDLVDRVARRLEDRAVV